MSPHIPQVSYLRPLSSSLSRNEPVLRHAGHCVSSFRNRTWARSSGTPSTSRRQWGGQTANERGAGGITTSYTEPSACSFVTTIDSARSERSTGKCSKQSTAKYYTTNRIVYTDFSTCTRCFVTKSNGARQRNIRPDWKRSVDTIKRCSKSPNFTISRNTASSSQHHLRNQARSSVINDYGKISHYSFRLFGASSTCRFPKWIEQPVSGCRSVFIDTYAESNLSDSAIVCSKRPTEQWRNEPIWKCHAVFIDVSGRDCGNNAIITSERFAEHWNNR